VLTPDYPAKQKLREALRSGLIELKQSLRELPRRKSMAAFLLANMIYTDGLVCCFAFGGIYAAGTFNWQTIQIGSFAFSWPSPVLRSVLRRQARRFLRPKRVNRRQHADPAIVDRSYSAGRQGPILFIKVAPPASGGALFSSASERAYLVLGCLIGAAGGRAGRRRARC